MKINQCLFGNKWRGLNVFIKIKNIFIKEEIRRICYSHEFNKMYIESIEKFRELKGSDRKCDSENRALNHTIESIKLLTSKLINEPNLKTVFLKPLYGDASGVRGAALLGRENFI